MRLTIASSPHPSPAGTIQPFLSNPPFPHTDTPGDHHQHNADLLLHGKSLQRLEYLPWSAPSLRSVSLQSNPHRLRRKRGVELFHYPGELFGGGHIHLQRKAELSFLSTF